MTGKIVVTALLLVSLASAVSCRRDPFDTPAPVDRNAISILAREAKPMAVKSAGENMELIFSEDSLEVWLEVTESDMPDTFVRQDTVQTKGLSYSGDNIGDFSVTAFLSTDTSAPFFDLDLDSDGTVVGTGYYWPVTTPATKITFFGYAKNQASGTIDDLSYFPETKEGSFDYTLPAPEGDNTSAVEQPDMLFAIAPDRVNTGEAVGLDFHHALSSIVFKVGSIPADFIVEKVEFTNIPSSGSCSYAADADGNITFDWVADTPKDFVQTFGVQMSDENGVVADEAVSTPEQTFMMIPGTLPDDSEIVITVSFEKGDRPNTTYVIRKPLKDLLAAWTAGKQYTYRISSPEEIEVEVDDDVVENDTKKENLEIRNTGLATSYMRVIMTGYWVIPGETEAEDLIVGQWKQPAVNVDDPEADGVYEQVPDFDDNWIVGDDGFYYYRHPVPSGEKTKDLFRSYTLTGNPPVVAAELVLSIAVQAVIQSKIGETPWPVKTGSDGKTLEKR